MASPAAAAAARAATATDLLEHPDPHTAAQAATVENLLRCWVRENDIAAPAGDTLRIPLPATGTALLTPVHYWSPTGWHRFGLPHLADAPNSAPPADAVTVAALLARETTRTGSTPGPVPGSEPSGTPGSERSPRMGPRPGTELDSESVPSAEPSARPSAEPSAQPGPDKSAQPGSVPDTEPGSVPGSELGYPPVVAPGAAPSHVADLVGRVADSVRLTTIFIRERRRRPADRADLFLSAEQALLLGHPMHPTAKSREGLSEAEALRYSPEPRGSFPLHWFAVAPSVLAADSAWTERGRPLPAGRLTERLAGPDLPLPDGFTALPMHPWQAREIRHRADAAALLDAGLLRDLGPHGEPWHPTSSVRTVHRSGTPAMLKLSLGLRITNSRRENLRKELHRGVEVHRLLRSGLGKQWQSVHPGFDIVRDPAWVAVDDADGTPVTGLDVVIRHNPFAPTDDASCIAGLVSPRPHALPTGQRRPAPDSRLAEIVTRLVGRTGRARDAVATEWFLRYLEQVVRPVLWLDGEAGIALEAHQQNTVLLLDPEGWPTGGRYRDNQGYYFRESQRAELDARLPGIGEHSDTFVSDEVTDERFAYYLGINNVLGLIGAFGSQRLADERLLLAAFRRFLADAATGPGRLRTSLPAHLLDSPVLRCKANLLTRLHGLDELVGPVDTQSVYVTITNPLHS
ncbi:IucA/IucC family protein [Streptomyces sp. CGMCC 4.7035]|nr:IucA/IucC family protein [Streptomyces sp. CGMCC 4.7035]WNC03068.1 IucA/IucC family protein [Streptomyces sp. CGMCC 4.7035]